MPGTSAPAPPDIRFCGRPPFATAREAQEIVDLVALLLGDALTGIDNPMPDAIMLETLSGGRSGAYVFKATDFATDGRTRDGAPAVVKIARFDAGTSEKTNYERFVRPLLPAVWRPDLLGFATAHGHAALCYSYLGDGERPETLTDRLAVGDLAALDFVLSSLFEELRQGWYGARQATAEADLARYYLDRYFEDFGSATAAETVLFGHAARYFDAQHCARGYRIGETVFPSICGELFAGHDRHAYTSCILHGDLNSDNIILGRNCTFAQLIDFQRTGPGHVLQDLVTLEASLRINYPSDAPLSDILEIERLIALGDPRIRSNAYAMAIVGIRETARRLFGFKETAANYQFAVATIGLRLMKAADLSDAAHARISASALWAAKIFMEN